MPKRTSEPTALDAAWSDILECARAFRKRPNPQNQHALDVALDGYRREYLRDFEPGGSGVNRVDGNTFSGEQTVESKVRKVA